MWHSVAILRVGVLMQRVHRQVHKFVNAGQYYSESGGTPDQARMDCDLLFQDFLGHEHKWPVCEVYALNNQEIQALRDDTAHAVCFGVNRLAVLSLAYARTFVMRDTQALELGECTWPDGPGTEHGAFVRYLAMRCMGMFTNTKQFTTFIDRIELDKGEVEVYSFSDRYEKGALGFVLPVTDGVGIFGQWQYAALEIIRETQQKHRLQPYD